MPAAGNPCGMGGENMTTNKEPNDPRDPAARRETGETSAAIGRIRQMEALYDRLLQALETDPTRLGTEEALREAARTLSEYQTGGDWLRDYALDEQGLLPAELKRGVLSQDGLYDLLCRPEVAAALAEEPAWEAAAENEYMRAAIREATEGITGRHGGPFGCVIVRDGKIVGRGHNQVLRCNDPTLHGEIAAIRDAGQTLGTFDLSGCELYTTGEPCPMCLCACLWANIDRVYYGCTIRDNERIGFRDGRFDRLFGGREAFGDYLVCIDREACLALFDAYEHMDRTGY